MWIDIAEKLKTAFAVSKKNGGDKKDNDLAVEIPEYVNAGNKYVPTGEFHSPQGFKKTLTWITKDEDSSFKMARKKSCAKIQAPPDQLACALRKESNKNLLQSLRDLEGGPAPSESDSDLAAAYVSKVSVSPQHILALAATPTDSDGPTTPTLSLSPTM